MIKNKKKRSNFYSKEYYILTSTWYRNKKFHNLIDGVIEWLNERSCGGWRTYECDYSKIRQNISFSVHTMQDVEKKGGRNVFVNTSGACTAPNMEYG